MASITTQRLAYTVGIPTPNRKPTSKYEAPARIRRAIAKRISTDITPLSVRIPVTKNTRAEDDGGHEQQYHRKIVRMACTTGTQDKNRPGWEERTSAAGKKCATPLVVFVVLPERKSQRTVEPLFFVSVVGRSGRCRRTNWQYGESSQLEVRIAGGKYVVRLSRANKLRTSQFFKNCCLAFSQTTHTGRAHCDRNRVHSSSRYHCQ